MSYMLFIYVFLLNERKLHGRCSDLYPTNIFSIDFCIEIPGILSRFLVVKNALGAGRHLFIMRISAYAL